MHARRTAIFNPRRSKQRGAALMVMLVIMVMGSAAFLVSSLSRSALRIEQNQNSSQILAQAKEVVLGYAAGSSNVGVMLLADQLVSPIEVTDGVPGAPNYDGDWDSCQSNNGCLGRFPWKAYGMSISAPSENDPIGVMPWYAISGNLYAADVTTFNSEILTTAPHPWLTVRDMKGNILSNRVAIVLLLPGSPMPNQSRSISPNLGGPNQYLDSINVPVGCTAPCIPGTYNNYDLDNDFIIGDEHRWIADPNNPAKQIEDSSYQFNDKLIYITIDELMPLIEKRVGNEVKSMLKKYYDAWGAYPFATSFSDPSTSSFVGAAGTFNGLLSRASTANLSVFPVWRSASFTSSATGGTVSGTFAMKVGTKTNSSWRYESMVITGTPTITITGILDNIGFGLWPPYDPTTTQISVRVGGTYYPASDPTNGMTNVSVKGTLQPDGSALVIFKGTVQAGKIPDRIRFKDIRPCIYQATYCPSISTTWPAWFSANNWDQVVYYATSPGYAPAGGNTCNPLPGTPSCLTVNGSGGGNDKRAVVVMTSSALSIQAAHPSNTLSDYLELENATPTDFIYENKTRSNIFNDQVIIVAP